MEIGVAVGFCWVGCQVDGPRWHEDLSEVLVLKIKLRVYSFCIKHIYHMFKVFLIYVFLLYDKLTNIINLP